MHTSGPPHRRRIEKLEAGSEFGLKALDCLFRLLQLLRYLTFWRQIFEPLFLILDQESSLISGGSIDRSFVNPSQVEVGNTKFTIRANSVFERSFCSAAIETRRRCGSTGFGRVACEICCDCCSAEAPSEIEIVPCMPAYLSSQFFIFSSYRLFWESVIFLRKEGSLTFLNNDG